MVWRYTHLTGALATRANYSIPIPQGTVIPLSTETEIRDDSGDVVRLNPGAELEIETGPLGQTAVYYGNVAIFGLSTKHHKYRTSCYVGSRSLPTDTHIVNLAPDTDRFSCYRGMCVVTEFDEQNVEFVICTIDAGYWVDLKAQQEGPMRERYTVITTGKLTESDYSSFINDFGPPKYPVGL